MTQPTVFRSHDRVNGEGPSRKDLQLPAVGSPVKGQRRNQKLCLDASRDQSCEPVVGAG